MPKLDCISSRASARVYSMVLSAELFVTSITPYLIENIISEYVTIPCALGSECDVYDLKVCILLSLNSFRKHNAI